MKNQFNLKSVIICGILCLANILAYGQTGQKTDSINLFVDKKMRDLHIPALQLAVIRQGQIVKLKSYGLANIENNVPATDESVFSINSCTKAFVGVAIMQLQERGKLNVNDPISMYIDSLPAAWQHLTLKQLLTNSSGLPNIIDEYEHILAGGNENAAWAKVKTLPMEFKPNEKFSYNQTGYVILGKIINKLSGEPFAKFIKENQFDVVGMKETRFGDSYDVVPHSAGAYSVVRNQNGLWTQGEDLRSNFVEFPDFFRTASGILSTAKEIAQWLIAVQNGTLLKDKQSLTTLWTPAILDNGQVGGFNKLVNGYALGWPTVTRSEHPAVGPVGGMRTSFFVYPQDDLSIVVLTNLQGANPEYFIDEIAGYYIPEMHESNGFGLPPSVKLLRKELLKVGFNKAAEVSASLKRQSSTFVLQEDDLNNYGYRLIGEGKVQDGLSIFKLNTTLYPKSGNAFDSYAETLTLTGDKNGAIKNYKKSFELNPQNTNAAEQIKKLQN